GQVRYRLRAEVRHLKSGNLGRVGIYCTHREDPAAGGPIHRFTHLTFNDKIEDAAVHAELPPDLPPRLRPRPPEGHRVILLHRPSRDGGPEARWDREIGRGGAFRFQPAGPGSAPWRTLTVLVTPERVEARWGADGERVGDLWSADLRSRTRATLDGLRK